jgi:hypothetical protein
MVIIVRSPHAALANDIGRYQAIPLPKSESEVGERIMILDTSTGDLWQWWDAPALANVPARSGVTYMGKVAPGSAPGETRSFQRFDKPD